MRRAAVLALLFALPLHAQTTRVASDFEIAQMEQQLARSHDFLAQLSGRLNLGDVRMTRNEPSLARAEYGRARELAANERLAARRASEMTRYATATSYAALAEAKLGAGARAFELAEEALRYTSDSAKTWNLYASTMTLLRKPAKAAGAARNAVDIARREVAASPTIANRLDLAVYEYSLASALIDSRRDAEAEPLLREVIASLQSSAFEPLKRDVANREAFEIYSSARGDAASYIALLNRSQLRLGTLYESRGDAAAARRQYENVLAARTDDPTALAALARLSRAGYAEAFDANPFSLDLVRDYQRYLDSHVAATVEGNSTGARVRRAIVAGHRGEVGAARTQLDALLQQFPANETLRTLRRDLDAPAAAPSFLRAGVTTATPASAELRSLVALFNGDRLTPEQRAALDAITFTSVVAFDDGQAAADQTIFERGTIDGVPFRFSEPIAFRGTFAAHAPLRLTYAILGASNDALLLEPKNLEAVR